MWVTFSHSKDVFGGWVSFYIGNRLQETQPNQKFSANNLLFVNGCTVFSKTVQVCPRKLQAVNSQSLRIAFVDSSGDLSDSPDNHGRNAVVLEWC